MEPRAPGSRARRSPGPVRLGYALWAGTTGELAAKQLVKRGAGRAPCPDFDPPRSPATSDPAVSGLAGVEMRTLDDLEQVVEGSVRRRGGGHLPRRPCCASRSPALRIGCGVARRRPDEVTRPPRVTETGLVESHDRIRRRWDGRGVPHRHVRAGISALLIRAETRLKSMNSRHAREREIAVVLMRHGMDYLVRAFGLDRLVSAAAALARYEAREDFPTPPENLRRALEELGPTFVKLGQLRVDARGCPARTRITAELRSSRTRCRRCRPTRSTRSSTRRGATILDAVFTSFDREPLAAASIGQVHAAKLKETDDHPELDVVVKLQRPGAAADRAQESPLSARAARRGEHPGGEGGTRRSGSSASSIARSPPSSTTARKPTTRSGSRRTLPTCRR